jgi:hypothetical protein
VARDYYTGAIFQISTAISLRASPNFTDVIRYLQAYPLPCSQFSDLQKLQPKTPLNVTKTTAPMVPSMFPSKFWGKIQNARDKPEKYANGWQENPCTPERTGLPGCTRNKHDDSCAFPNEKKKKSDDVVRHRESS